MDRILIRDLRIDAHIGIHKREKYMLQTLAIDLDIGLPHGDVFATDKLQDSIDYEQAASQIGRLATRRHYNLVETFAQEIANLLIDTFGAPWVRVSVFKVGILANAKLVGVSIERAARPANSLQAVSRLA